MFSKRLSFGRNTGNWAMALALVAILLVSAVSPAYAAGDTVQSIVVGPQGSALVYGTAGSASFTVTVHTTAKISNVVFTIAGLPAGATGAFLPAKLSFSGAQTKSTTLTITTTSATPATVRPFTVGYKVQGTAGLTTGSGSLTVGPRVLDVQGVLVQDKAYDGNVNATLGVACTAVVTTNCAYLVGVINSDVVSLNMAAGHGVFASKDAGAEDVSVTGLSIGGTGASNYSLPASIMSSATINPAVLTVTANSAFKASGFPDPAFTFSYDGFVAGETDAVITTAPSCGVSGLHDAVGSYPISCSGGSAQNYTFNYVDGTLTVNAADNVPSDIGLSASSVAERQPAGLLVGYLTTTDADSIYGETYSYSLVDTVSCAGPDNASFSVLSFASAGPVALRTAAVLHYVTQANYTICVETNDGNGGTLDKQFVISALPSTSNLKSYFSYDGWVLESGENTNVGGTKNNSATTLLVGDDAKNRQYRSILSFSTGLLPDNATIYSVTIKVKKQKLTTANLFTQLGGLRVDVKKPSFGALKLDLNDFQALVGLSGKLLAGKFGPTPDSGGWYSASIPSSAFQYINKVGATQFRLRFNKDDNNNFKADTLSLYSGNALRANKPQLIIVYSVP
jgi:hypothetical protein